MPMTMAQTSGRRGGGSAPRTAAAPPGRPNQTTPTRLSTDARLMEGAPDVRGPARPASGSARRRRGGRARAGGRRRTLDDQSESQVNAPLILRLVILPLGGLAQALMV